MQFSIPIAKPQYTHTVGPCSGKYLTQLANLYTYVENFEIIVNLNTGRLKMPACNKWKYLVIFKAYCEFTGTNDALKPFNLFTMLCNKNKKIIGQRSM